MKHAVPSMMAVAIILAMSMAGCQDTSSEGSLFVPEPVPVMDGGCIKETCVAESNSSDFQYALDAYGLHQINSDSGSEYGPFIEEELAVWQHGRRINGTPASNIYASNLVTRELIPVGWEDYYHDTLPYLSQGNVVFAREPVQGAPDASGSGYMMHWNGETRERIKLETGLDGEAQPFGYDHPWVVFRNRYSTDESQNGLYALNVDSSDVVNIYTIKPREDGEVLGGEAVADGYVYYEVHGTETGELDARLYEVNLTTGKQKVVFTNYGEFPVGMTASGRFVAWEVIWAAGAPHFVRVFDRETREAIAVTDFQEGQAYDVSIGDDWVSFVWDASNGAPERIDAVHLPSMERITLATQNEELLLSRGHHVSEGRAIVSVFTSPHLGFSEGQQNLYLVELPME